MHESSSSEVGKTASPVIAPRSDALADCVRARARGGYSVSRRSKNSVAAPPTPYVHESSFSEETVAVAKTASPVTAPRSDALADCVRARARGGNSVSRRSKKLGRHPPTPILVRAQVELFRGRQNRVAGHRTALRRPRRLCACKGTRWLLRFSTVQILGRRPAKTCARVELFRGDCRVPTSPVTAPRSDALADCVRARARGGNSVSRRSKNAHVLRVASSQWQPRCRTSRRPRPNGLNAGRPDPAASRRSVPTAGPGSWAGSTLVAPGRVTNLRTN